MRLIWLAILNLSSAPLHNTMVVVNDDAVEIGVIKVGKSVKVEIPKEDSCRVIFTLGQKREDWLGTDLMSTSDTIKIDDKTNIYDVDICFD